MAQQVTGELLMENIQRYAQNPTALFRTMLLALEQSSDGKYFAVDPGNPFVFLQEMACMLSAGNVIEARAVSRKLYASLAETPDELYRHMSDKDHVGRFGTPAQATIDFWFSYDEVMNAAVPVTEDALSVRKLTIARNTRIMAGGYPFTLQYPIDIIVKANGGLTVVHDTSILSPFLRLTTNKVKWSIGRVMNRRYLVIRVPMWQMRCDTQINPLNAVTGFSKTFTFSDNFYYCRAFIKNEEDGLWTEVRTTHTDQVYDPNHPTVVLNVDTVNRTLNAKVPQIYFNNGTIRTQLRLDIYTTLGKVDLSLRNFDPGAYSAKWIDLDDPAGSRFRAPLDSFSDLKIRSDDVITGGADALPFETLRKRVVENTLDIPLIPLTAGGLEATLQDVGFNMVVNVDDITDREIIATRRLPTPKTISTGSGVGVTVGTILTKLSEWQLNTGIEDNGIRMTIKPTALFDMKDGVVKLIPSDTVNNLLNPAMTSVDQLATNVNNNSYAFSPFFYVLDTQNETFAIRPYRLDKPTLVSQFFVNENTLAGVNVSSQGSTIQFAETKDGWDLFISVDGTGLWSAFEMEDVFVQLSYIDVTTGIRHYINGTQMTAIDPETERPVDNLYVYQFHLGSNFDIDDEHRLRFTAAGLIDLEHDFDLVFMVKNWMPDYVNNTDIDTLINPATIPGHTPTDVYLGLTHETVRIHIGDYLENLWRRSRSIVGDMEYVLNPGPTTYKHQPKTLYVLDGETGNIDVNWNAGTSTLESEVLHYQGDPIIPVPTILTDTEATAASDTVINFTSSVIALTPGVRYAFILWGAGVDGKTLVGTCVQGPDANSVELSVPVVTGILAGAKFVYGVQAILAEEGEPAVDSNGNLIPISARPNGMKREFDILLMDGRYYFAKDENSIADKDEAVDFMTSWLEEELDGIAERLLERTELFFFPTVTMGTITAISAGNQPVAVNAEQKLTVIYYMAEDRFNNDALRTALEKSTPQLIAQAMENKTISRTLLERTLVDAASSDVVSVEVIGFNTNGAQTLTFVDPLTRPTLAKRLGVTAAGVLQVVESIDVLFERYSGE